MERNQERLIRLLKKRIVVSAPGIYKCNILSISKPLYWEESKEPYRIVNTNIINIVLAKSIKQLYLDNKYQAALNKVLSHRAKPDAAIELLNRQQAYATVSYVPLKNNEQALMITGIQPIELSIAEPFLLEDYIVPEDIIFE